MVLLWRAAVIESLTPFPGVATWILFASFVIAVVVNLISRSRAERAGHDADLRGTAVCTLLVAIG